MDFLSLRKVSIGSFKKNNLNVTLCHTHTHTFLTYSAFSAPAPVNPQLSAGLLGDSVPPESWQ